MARPRHSDVSGTDGTLRTPTPPFGLQTAAPETQTGTRTEDATAEKPRDSVKPVMISSRKRAAVRSLSPRIRPLSQQDHGAPEAAQTSRDPQWEARLQEAVRIAMLTIPPHPVNISHMP